MQVFVSTVLRGAPIERGGELIAVDWDSGKVTHRIPLPLPDPIVSDSNTRGGFRGGRGLALFKDGLFVATYHTLLGFDYNFRPTHNITHKNFSGLHEVKHDGDGIWVTATPLGAIVKVDRQGQPLAEWWAHDDPVVQREFGVQPLVLDKARDNRLAVVEDASKSKLHLNNVEVHQGRVYVSFNAHGAVLRLFPTEIIARSADLKGCHNGLVTDDGELLVNNSHHHALVVFDLATGAVRREMNLADFPAIKPLLDANTYRGIPWWIRVRNFIIRQRMSRPLFTRGMCLLDQERVLIGVSPASVLELDFRRGKLLRVVQLSDAVNECVHGLEAVPSVDYPGWK